jgi:hypothetical protein
MKHKNSLNAPEFVEYNDNNLEHTREGPSYGQPNSSSAWEEINSVEYPDYVKEIRHRILTHHVKILLSD